MPAASSPTLPTTSALLLSPISLAVGAGIAALAFVLPEEGLGVDLCLFHRATGLPCPGCGLTRSVASTARLHLESALAHHPFGPLVLALALGLVAASLSGRGGRARLRAALDARERSARRIYLGLVGAFVIFGVVRLVVEAAARS